MTDRVVLVNGLPGAGKTTLATALAGRLEIPLFAKDAIKEAVADAVPGVVVPGLGPAVMELVWRLAAATPGPVSRTTILCLSMVTVRVFVSVAS